MERSKLDRYETKQYVKRTPNGLGAPTSRRLNSGGGGLTCQRAVIRRTIAEADQPQTMCVTRPSTTVSVTRSSR
jgi:hypothetical protein